MTGAATIVASAAVAVVIFTADPASAPPALLVLFWVAFSLMCWGLLATVLIVARQSIAQAVWASFVGVCGVVAALIARQRGITDARLLGGALLATLCISVAIWWRLRRGPVHEEPTRSH